MNGTQSNFSENHHMFIRYNYNCSSAKPSGDLCPNGAPHRSAPDSMGKPKSRHKFVQKLR